MKTKQRNKNMKRFFGRGTHLYSERIVIMGWLVVPILWSDETYAFSYISPAGLRYINWSNYLSIQAALKAGSRLVYHRIKGTKKF